MKRIILALFLLLGCISVQAGIGFGIQVGAYSPTSGVDDNDNAVLFGAHFKAKLAVIGIKAEAYFLDSTGNYTSQLGEEFGATNVGINNILALDAMFYPMGTTFFLQAGLNYTSLDVDNLEDLLNIDDSIVENEIGVEIGAGITLFDKLMVQGKIMYTPGAIDGSAVDALENLDENLMGYMVTVGWNF